MQAVEALTLLLKAAEKRNLVTPTIPEREEIDVAISIGYAMLNTALPVAKFRCFVRIESGRMEGREFTICSPVIEDIVAALSGLTHTDIALYVSLWEQKPTGADMLEGYQGKARKDMAFRVYLDGLKKYSVTYMAN